LDFDLRVKAVHHFSALPEAQSLAAANKRVSNILQKETQSDGTSVDSGLLREEAEKELARVVQDQKTLTLPLFQQREYTRGLELMAQSRPAIDALINYDRMTHEMAAVRTHTHAVLRVHTLCYL